MNNLAKKGNFRIDIPDNNLTKTFQWQIQAANVPAVTMETAAIARGPKHSKIGSNNIAGSGTSYSDLNISFLVDEDLKTYAELYAWILTMNNPIGASNPDGKVPVTLLLHVLDNNKKGIVATFEFYNCFPKELGEIDWNYTESGDIDSVVCEVTFEYSYFNMLVDGKPVVPYE